MSARLKGLLRRLPSHLLWLVREAIPAALLIIACGGLFWALTVRRHTLPMVHGGFGKTGRLSLPKLLVPGTIVESFTAEYNQLDVLWIPFFGHPIPVPMVEALEVTVVYRQPGKASQTWQQTYLIACDNTGKDCVVPRRLIGVTLCGAEPDCDTEEASRWIYLRDPLGSRGVPPSPTPNPKPIPSPTPTPVPPPYHPGPIFPSDAPRRI